MPDVRTRMRVRRGTSPVHVVAALALAACSGESVTPAATGGAATGVAIAPAASAATMPLVVDTIARGLAVPWAIAAAPDGRLLVTERAGRIRVVEGGQLRPAPWATLPVYADDPRLLPEAGLMGIALAPDFATSRHVYVMGTFRRDPADTSRGLVARARRRWKESTDAVGAIPFENRIYRLTDRDGQGVEPVLVAGGLPANYYHAGGVLAFGPDGALYATLGDAMHPEAAGHGTRTLASIVRLPAAALGRPPVTPAVVARGLRNAQGLAWHPRTRELFAVDHGPSGMAQEGGHAGNDELNAVRAGAWYGWGARPADAREAVAPVAVWTTAIAPARLAFAPAAAWGEDVVLATGLRSRALHLLRLRGDSASGWTVAAQERLLEGHGRLRAIALTDDGAVLVSTSNADGRGTRGPDGDLLLRVRPGAAPAAPTAGPSPLAGQGTP